MTKNEILAEAGRRLGDTSTEFLTTRLSPAFDMVLRDLAAYEAIAALRCVSVFAVEQDVRVYDMLSVTKQLTYPMRVVSVTVYGWGTSGEIQEARDDELKKLRLLQGEDTRGYWQLWQAEPNTRRLLVQPPAGEDEAGADCEIVFDASPNILSDEQGIEDILDEDLETIVYGLQMRLAPFGEDTAGDVAMAAQLYFGGRNRMWGRRFNDKVGQVQAVPC